MIGKWVYTPLCQSNIRKGTRKWKHLISQLHVCVWWCAVACCKDPDLIETAVMRLFAVPDWRCQIIMRLEPGSRMDSGFFYANESDNHNTERMAGPWESICTQCECRLGGDVGTLMRRGKSERKGKRNTGESQSKERRKQSWKIEK